MPLLLAVLLLAAPGADLGLGRSSVPEPARAERDEADEHPRPVLLPGMPVEETSELRSFHPLLSDLVTLARPIREKLRDLELWNLRPDYRDGEFCISWEIRFSL
jgi:hypothetical protein